MQEKFTRQAVNALKLARSTVQSCKHTYIGTEHILVGLLKERRGLREEFWKNSVWSRKGFRS